MVCRFGSYLVRVAIAPAASKYTAPPKSHRDVASYRAVGHFTVPESATARRYPLTLTESPFPEMLQFSIINIGYETKIPVPSLFDEGSSPAVGLRSVQKYIF
jgi:hypothetical protein